MDTPPITPTTAQRISKHPFGDLSNIRAFKLTPPTSPKQDISSCEGVHGLGLSGINGQSLAQGDRRVSASPGPLATIECPFEVEILRDWSGREQVYGSGAWSTVVKAVRQGSTGSRQNPTPPSSPTPDASQLVAVKRPARRDAVEIIQSEGVILSHLACTEGSEAYVVPFYGVLSMLSSLVLAAIPISLEEHIRNCALESEATRTTWNMSEPVVGTTNTWLQLAHHLTTALAWLHDAAGVTHGDIKPGNILLSPLHDRHSLFPYTPLYADFSSGQFLDSDATTPNTLSAVTREYTAPELLSYAVFSNPNSTTTPASDVFSLAVTLLVAATGELMVYPGSQQQRQLMASQGWYILSHARNGDQGARVPRHGVVEQVLEKAVLKAGMGRIDAESWAELVREKMRVGPQKRL